MLLNNAGWIYVLMAIPLLAYMVFVPFWLRDLKKTKRIVATVLYMILSIVLIICSIVFIFLYGNCLENCHATKNDEVAMLVSSLIITIYLGCVFWVCKSYNELERPDNFDSSDV